MITTADAPAWLRRSDQAVTWARTMLTCGIARERDCSADGKPHDSGTLSPEQDRQAQNGIPVDLNIIVGGTYKIQRIM